MADNSKAELKDFEDIVLPYLDAVYRAAVALCGDKPDAEDLTQTTFMKALNAFDAFEPGMDCKSWLLRILRATWKDRISQKSSDGSTVSFEDALACMPDEGLRTPHTLEDRILAQIAACAGVPEKRVLPFRLPAWSAWVGLAAILILTLFLAVRLRDPSFPARAQNELVQIHLANLAPDSPMFQDRNPEKLSSYLNSKLGVTLQLPKTTPAMTIQGCGIRKFLNKTVGCYILDTPLGTVSIIVIPHHPITLGLKERPEWSEGDTGMCWVKSIGEINLAAVRRENFSYIAVGPLPREKLIEVLLTAYRHFSL